MLTCPFLLFFDNKNQNPNICPIKKEKKSQIPNIYTTAMSLQTKVVVSVMWQGEKMCKNYYCLIVNVVNVIYTVTLIYKKCVKTIIPLPSLI